MALSVFDDKEKKPRPRDLELMLGRTNGHWHTLVSHISTEHAPLEETWIFSGAKWGWSLRLKQKKRTVLYLTPCQGYFLAGFALGEKAVESAHASSLPDTVVAAIDTAPRFAEGRGVRLEIRNKKDAESTKRLAAIKMAT